MFGHTVQYENRNIGKEKLADTEKRLGSAKQNRDSKINGSQELFLHLTGQSAEY